MAENIKKRLIALGIEGSANKIGVGIVTSDGEILSNPRKTFITPPGQGFRPKEASEHHSSKVLELLKLDIFCMDYDRARTEEGASSINFIRLESDKKTILTDEGKKAMKDMLSVWDNHCIHICHPNHLFAGAKPLTADVREMTNINWNDIDIERMFRINDYKTFLTPDCSQAFRYVHERLGHQIMREIRRKNREAAISYLAIVEQYTFDYEDNYLVRGLIRGDADGYSIAFNPEYQKTIPQSVWERSLRMSDHEIPPAYLVKRKK